MTPLEKDRRKHPRVATDWRATLRTLRRVYDCRVTDISPEGVQIRLITPEIGAVAAIGEAVMVSVTDVGRIVGALVWQQKSSIGIRITDPHAIEAWTATITKFPTDASGRILGMKQPAEPSK